MKGNIFFAAILFTLSTGCGSFRKNSAQPLVHVETDNYESLNGRYTTRTDTSRQSKNFNLWPYLTREPMEETLLMKDLSVDLKMISKRRLQITLYDGEARLSQKLIKGKLRKGYFKLRDKTKLNGIPPLFWTLFSEKTRIGKSAKGNLQLENVSARCGMAIFFLASTPDTHVALGFQPIQKH
ncbi:hypothetical protein DBR43_23055 [Pedobacter sp. KBW06]|uniref:hypothetical protein n=1 Tax=Pedobacter sp. KBW06 TaxID=2153359 RepID=UPI000F5AE9F7|nr:hypothetical protein [Pedobacter sp. KBW06]RQO67419.1 hypothetical protein DBR43_23055 [Pedobacter sp. KBW06]